MADLANIDKNEIVLVDPDNSSYEAKILSDGSQLVRVMQNHWVLDDKAFGVSLEPNLSSTSQIPAILIRNPGGSGKKLYLTEVLFQLVSTVTARCRIRLYKGPTVTATGSAATISPARVGGSLPSSAMEVYTLPTVSANGTQIAIWSCDQSTTVMDNDFHHILDAGYDLLVTGQSESSNKPLGATVRWAEF